MNQKNIEEIIKQSELYKQANELILDMFGQACWLSKEKKYDHMFLSIYEEAQQYLLEKGLIKPKDCYRKP